MDDEIRERAEKLWKRVRGNEADPEELVKLSLCEYELGNREQSARLLLDAVTRNPEADYPRRLYNARYAPEELKAWNLTIAPTPIRKDLKNIFLYARSDDA